MKDFFQLFAFQSDAYNEMIRLNKTGLTIVLVEHPDPDYPWALLDLDTAIDNGFTYSWNGYLFDSCVDEVTK